jgi:hypothetical protein
MIKGVVLLNVQYSKTSWSSSAIKTLSPMFDQNHLSQIWQPCLRSTAGAFYDHDKRSLPFTSKQGMLARSPSSPGSDSFDLKMPNETLNSTVNYAKNSKWENSPISSLSMKRSSSLFSRRLVENRNMELFRPASSLTQPNDAAQSTSVNTTSRKRQESPSCETFSLKLSNDSDREVDSDFKPSTDRNKVNIDHIMKGKDARTTVMIKNVPNRYSQQMLKDFLDNTNWGEYDFLYLRMDFLK